MNRKRNKHTRLGVALSAALALTAMLSTAEPAKSYKTLHPLLTVDVRSLFVAGKALEQGLSGSGFPSSAAISENILARYCNLPSFDFADKEKPLKYFLLTQTPIAATPDYGLVVPLKFLGDNALTNALNACYANVQGGNLKTYSSPSNAKWPETLFVVATPKQGFIATSFDAIRWMMSNVKNGTLPAAANFRSHPVAATLDARLCSEFLSVLLSNLPEAINEEATYKNTALHMRELGVLCEQLSTVDVTLNADMVRWDASIRLNFQDGSFQAQKVGSLPAPLDDHLKLIPPLVTTRNVSALPAFVSLLPTSNRKWLASLAVNTQLLGSGILPGLFEIDEKLRLFVEGIYSSAYVIDTPSGLSGKVSVYPLKNPEATALILTNALSTPDRAPAGCRATIAPSRQYKGTPVYSYAIETDKTAGQTAGASPVIEAITFVLQMRTVEVAVKHGNLIVAQGSKGLINKWIEQRTPSNWDEQVTSFSTPFPKTFRSDDFLGGGLFDSVTLSRQIVNHVPGLRPVIQKMPQSGGGIAWRLVRSNSSLIFDIQPKCSEVMGLDQIMKIDSNDLHEFIAQIVLENFGAQGAEEVKQTPMDGPRHADRP